MKREKSQNRQVVLEICEILAEQEELKVTYRLALKDAIAVSTCALIGSYIMGTAGFVIGGVLMSGARAFLSRGKYKSVVNILRNLTPDQRKKLIDAVMTAIRNLNFEDVSDVLPLILSSESLREVVLNVLISFINNEFNENVN